jgi:Tol biopolymer transport system component
VTPPPQPTPDLIGTPEFEREGPGIVYQSTDLTLSNFDGSRKNVFAFVPRLAPWNTDFSPEAGRIVSESANSLWVLDLGKGSQEIFSSDLFIESPVISRDGAKIAYSLVHGFDAEGFQELWTINPDGSANTLLVEDTSRYIADPGPFRLVPVAWSLDRSKIYLTTTTDSEATPLGMYVADVPAGTIEKVLTPQVTLWDVAFSPDRTRIAYRTFQWVPVAGSMPEVGPPFTLQVTELATGATTVLQESDAFEYFHPVWSPDGHRLAYSVRSRPPGGEVGLFTIDLSTGAAIRLVPGSEGRQLRPWVWLRADRLVYTEELLAPGDASNASVALYTIKIDGSEQHEIDSANSMIVLGVLDD